MTDILEKRSRLNEEKENSGEVQVRTGGRRKKVEISQGEKSEAKIKRIDTKVEIGTCVITGVGSSEKSHSDRRIRQKLQYDREMVKLLKR